MANKISVLIDVTVDKANRSIESFRKAINDADGAAGKFKAGAGAVGTSIANNLTAVAATAGVAFAAFASKAIDAASDLQESTNAVNKSFGAAADGVLEVGESAAESFGLSKSAFNEAAVSFASFVKTIGGGRGSADILEDLTTRAADFASVMNIDVAEAATVFRSGLSGETEPLKKFGVNLSAAAVESYALAKGLVASKSEMTESIKVQARYGLLMESTSQFAGDFADTSDGLANSTRTLKARMTDLSAEFGEVLIPKAEAAIGVLLVLAKAVEGLQNLGAINPFVDHAGHQEMVDDLVEQQRTAEETAAIVEAENKKIAAAYIQNQRGMDAWADSVRESDVADSYAEHAAGMRRESQRLADKLTADWDRILGKIDEEAEWRNAQALFDDLRSAALTAWSEGAAGAEEYRLKQLAVNGELANYLHDLGTIPPEKASEIIALIDANKFDEAERRFAELTRPRSVQIQAYTSIPSGSGFRGVGTSGYGGAVDWDAVRRAYGGKDGDPSTPLAKGGIVKARPGGLIGRIGEAGHDEAVIPLSGPNMPKGLGGGTTINLTVNSLDARNAGKQIKQALDEYYRSGGPR